MKTEKEIYEYLWSRLRAFEPKDSDARTEFDWYLTKISQEFRAWYNAEEDFWHRHFQELRENAGQRIEKHEFVEEDGAGECCSCGWMCSGGNRSTCRSEWETHKAIALSTE